MTVKRLAFQGTTVSAAKSRADIETLVMKHGASSFASGFEGERANILFKMKNRRVRFELKLPKDDEREAMRRWRCLFHLLKSKLIAVAEGLASFEDEFLAFTLVPGHSETVAQWIGPQLAYAYEKGTAMRPLLGSGEGR